MNFLKVFNNQLRNPKAFDSRLVTGYVHKQVNGGLLIANDLFVYKIKPPLYASANLSMGDYIEAKVYYDEEMNSLAVQDVVNNLSPKVKFDKAKSIKPSKEISIQSNKVLLGSRTIITTDKTTDKINHMTKITAQDTYIISLILDEDDYVVDYLLGHEINEVFLVKHNFNIRKQLSLCMFAMFTAKRLASQKKNIVLILDSISKLHRLYHRAVSGLELNPSRINTDVLSDLKHFFSMSKALLDGGSLTVIPYINTPTNDTEQYLYDELTDLAATII